MWYMPYLRVRHAVFVYACLAVGISLVAIALRFWPGAVHGDIGAGLPRIDGAMLLAGGAALVGGLATVLGLNLAAENDGHLEVAWTKPVSREGYALGVFAVDIGAMAACVVLTALCALVVLDICCGFQTVTLPSGDGSIKAIGFLGFPLCVYAWIAALSASLKRNRGTIAGIFWPLMLVLAALPLIPVAAVHAVASTLNLFNPVAIYTTANGVPTPTVAEYYWGWLVAVVLLAAAVVQWRRLQL